MLIFSIVPSAVADPSGLEYIITTHPSMPCTGYAQVPLAPSIIFLGVAIPPQVTSPLHRKPPTRMPWPMPLLGVLPQQFSVCLKPSQLYQPFGPFLEPSPKLQLSRPWCLNIKLFVFCMASTTRLLCLPCVHACPNLGTIRALILRL